MTQQTSDWSAEDFAAEAQEDEGWSAADFDEQPAQQTVPQGIAGAYRGIGHAIAGGALEGLGSMAGFGGKIIDYLGGTRPSTPGGARPLPGGVQAPAYSEGPQVGAQLLGPAERALSQAGQEIYPQEERQQQGLPGQVAYTVGQMGAAAPFVAAGAPTAAFAFAAQNAMPAYYDVLAKTGSEEKANQALWANSAIGQLEFLGGGEKLAGGILKKLMTGEVGQAIKNGVLRMVMTQGAEVGTELAQTGLSDVLYENLTGEDLKNWERLKQTAPVAFLASAPFAVVDAAISAGPQTAQEAPGAQQAPEAAQPTQAPQPTPAALVEPEKAPAPEPVVGAAPEQEVETAAETEEPVATKPSQPAATEETVPQAEAGGPVAFHGSPDVKLTKVSADPANRQFDNATSQFGAFFTLDRQEAERYAGKSGKVYEVGVQLKNPYEMPWSEFAAFQRVEKDAQGKSTMHSVEAMKAREQELMAEARAMRRKLEAEGYDGIIVRSRSGKVVEIASFKDVAIGMSEAQPGASKAPSPSTTGIKNRTVERELTKMGVPLPEGPEGESLRDWHAEALAKTKEDPDVGRKLVDKLADHPRALDKNENALLSLEANKRMTAWEKAADEVMDDPSEENIAAETRAREDYQKAADVFRESGTTWGQAGVARQMMIARDESLAGVERTLAVARGPNVTAEERAEIAKTSRELAKELKETREKLEARLSHLETKAAEDATRRVQLELVNTMLKEKKSIISKKRRKTREAKILESKQKIDEILNKLASGHKAAAVFDPAKLALTVQLAAEHIRLGYQSFSLWADEVVSKVGEHIRPYLQPAWDQAKEAEEQAMLKTYKSRKATEIAKVQEQIATKQFDRKRRETPIHKDKEALRLKAEYEAARSKLKSEKRKLEISSMSKGKKLARAVHRLIRTPPHLLASFDLGGMLQQGGFFSLGHPIETLTSHLPRSLKAMRSEKAAREEAARIQNHPLYDLAVASKLPLMDWEGGTLSQREENLSESFAENIPGVGRGVKASNRQYTTFMNAQRFDNFVRQVLAHGKDITPEIARKIASDIGVVTGRGAVGTGRFAKAVDFLSSIFWSPRKNIGNFQTLTGQVFYSKGNRKKMAEEYVRSMMGAAGLLSLAYMAARAMGADEDETEVGGNALATDFGKLRVGDTTYDFFGGKAQWITFLARQAANMATTSKGRTYSLKRTEKDHKYTDSDITDIAKTFIRGKLTPTIGAYINWRTGENAAGEEMSGADVLKDLFIPITPGDMYEAFKKHGVSRAMADSLVSILGGSVQIKDKKKR